MSKLSALSRKALQERLDALLSQGLSIDDDDARDLFHELQVHQIELEMQNRQLREMQVELEEARQRYADLYDFAPVGYLTLDRQGVILQLNHRAAAWLGIARERLTSRTSLGSRIARSQRLAFAAYLDRVCAPRDLPADPLRTELTLECAGQAPRQVLMESVPAGHAASNESGAAAAPICHAALSDVTERLQAEAALREAHDTRAAILESMTEGLIMADPIGQVVAINPAAQRLHGFVDGREALRSLAEYPQTFDVRDLVGEIQPPESWPLARAMRGETFTNHELCVRRRDTGQTFTGSYGGAPVRDAEGRVRFGITTIRDISAQKRAEEQIRQLAFYDPLTQLPNRRLLEDRLKVALAQVRRRDACLAVMVLDLDHFKQINDSLGHGVGDALLVESAQRMQSCVRASDTVARPGGDEFMVIATEVTVEGAAHLAQKLVARLAEPLTLMGHDLSISCSVGISLAPDHGQVARELIAHADTAMYRAKQAGRHAYHFFTVEMQRDALQTLTLEHQLRKALAHGELCLHFQPQIELASGRPIGLEALVRWAHPERGLLGAGAFVPLAETCGLIHALGGWVLKAAAEQLRAWKRGGLPPLPVAVNLSALQLQRTRRGQALSGEVRALLQAHEIEPELLELEITENSLAKQGEGTLSTLRELRALGVRLTLDDFGTGYSSLSYLKEFPVDRLKIDQSFVGGLTVSAEDAAIVNTILALGEHLRFDVIAEGVETAEQLELLRRHGCREAQGFYFSQPLTPRETEAWLRRTI